MKLFEKSQDFLDILWLNYRTYDEKKETSRCFYYKYVKSRKDKKAEADFSEKEQAEERLKKLDGNQKVSDKYYFLHGAGHAYKEGFISKEAYRAVFEKLTGKNKNHLKYLKKFDEDIDTASKEYEHDLLKGCVYDYFRSNGFSINGEIKDSTGQDDDEGGYKDAIAMLYEYNKGTGASESSSGAQTSNVDDEYIEKCTVLYKVALQEKNVRAFIPLHFDYYSGAGIFIVGKNTFDKKKRNEISSDAVICIISFEEVGSSISYGSLEISVTVDVCGEERTDGELDAAQTVRSAFAQFRVDTEAPESNIYCDAYRYCHSIGSEYFCIEDPENETAVPQTDDDKVRYVIDDFFMPRMLFDEQIDSIKEQRYSMTERRNDRIAAELQLEEEEAMAAMDKINRKGKGSINIYV